MNWIANALVAVGFIGISDILRKLGSQLKDPYFTNLIFQIGSFVTTVVVYLLFSRKVETNQQGLMFALLGGVFVSLFTLFSFKTLEIGPGVSTVMPILRVGGVALVAILGVLLLREKLSLQAILGLLLSSFGIILLFSAK
ncbi:MAG TPA: EamA family transporter [Patescibacteria group bacterium]|nr:EamA family transporter [Patescibacteria group bacterium]